MNFCQCLTHFTRLLLMNYVNGFTNIFFTLKTLIEMFTSKYTHKKKWIHSKYRLVNSTVQEESLSLYTAILRWTLDDSIWQNWHLEIQKFGKALKVTEVQFLFLHSALPLPQIYPALYNQFPFHYRNTRCCTRIRK